LFLDNKLPKKLHRVILIKNMVKTIKLRNIFTIDFFFFVWQSYFFTIITLVVSVPWSFIWL